MKKQSVAEPIPGWAIYLRVSDEDKQKPEISFEMQRHRITEHLVSKSDLPVKGEYKDMLTGTDPRRADYQRMLSDAEHGLFSHLALYRADRFGRDVHEGLSAFQRLNQIGIKLRVAYMPTLMPETPDGFFLFLLQMGLAQREVEVLKQRTSDGMAAKLRIGGWPAKAPEGYVNKERLVRSGKYDRWVEKDPVQGQALRDAWEMLLTDRYTLADICEELTRRGYLRSCGKPWSYQDNQGRYITLRNRLSQIFRNPFYAGWAVSEKYGMPAGEVRGKWEPVVTPAEFERGVEILRSHDKHKSRKSRHSYLLKDILWLEKAGRLYRLYSSTSRGRSRYYSYYVTQSKVDGAQVHVSAEKVEGQIPQWLNGINVEPQWLPGMRELYNTQVHQVRHEDRDKKLVVLRRRVATLRAEEERLARLLISKKITEETYDNMRIEWIEKVRQAEADLATLETEATHYLDDLDLALQLLAQVSELYEQFDTKRRSTLLQIITKRIIVREDGEIIDHELHSPFNYLLNLTPGGPNNSSGSASGNLGSLRKNSQ